MTQHAYLRAVRELFLQLPHTHKRFSRSDRHLASQLFQRHTSIDTIRAALLLATARRLCRDPGSPVLPPVRSLYYFLPLIDEILLHPLPNGYLQYLEYKIAQHR